MCATAAYLLLTCLLMTTRPACGQQGCRQPTIPATPAGANIFDDEREVDLGDAIAQQVEPRLRVTDDSVVTAYLAQMGDRIARQLPPSHLQFRYYLVDLAIPNAFSVAGGRIYVARKLVAYVKSQDELAGVLGHEMGHIVTHQTAIQMTSRFGTVLGVHKVSDRQDVFARYNELLASWRRNPKAFRETAKHGEGHQEEADRVGLEAVAAAGYNPQGLADFFDRGMELKGKTGDWLSDLLGQTAPDVRRLREMLKGVEGLTQACSSKRPSGEEKEFAAWQTAVIQYTGWKRREALEGLVSKVPLEPLRAALSHVKFSPDSRYLLAQDADKIYVLTRQPLAFLFLIDALDARPAMFTPDSRAVVWFNSSLHVEKWDIETQQRVGAFEPGVAKGCGGTALSPDGKTLACEGADATLRLLDVATGNVLFEKKGFKPILLFPRMGVFMAVYGMAFSPDGRYFLAGNGGSAFGFDSQAGSEFSLRGAVKQVANGGLVFVGPERLVGWDASTAHQLDWVSFPEGKLLWHAPCPPVRFTAVTAGDYVLLGHLRDDGVDALDLAAGKIVWGYKTAGVDIYGQIAAGEFRNGELGLFEIKARNNLASVKLPGGDLTRADVGTAAGDLKWLAISAKKRGAIWNLETGKAAYQTREFSGAYFDRDAFFGDFPKYGDTPRKIVAFELATRRLEPMTSIEDERVQQHGRYLVLTKPAKSGLERDVTREVRDVVSGQSLWTRHFPKEAPMLAVEPVEGTINLMWGGKAGALEDELKSFPKLAGQYEAAKEKKWIIFVEEVEARTGKPLAALLVDTNLGSFTILDNFSVGDWLFFTNAQGQVVVYSYSTGEKIGAVMGTNPEAAKAAGLLCVASNPDQLAVYDIASLELVHEYSFSSPVAFKSFSQDGKRLLVLTADQTAYQLDVSSLVEEND